MKTPSLSIELVTRAADFSALEHQWNVLLHTSAQNTVFLSWQWLHTWWQVFAVKGMQLQILLFRYQGELVGIAPLYLQPGGMLNGSVLRFIGTGEPEEDQVVSEYLDVFSSPCHESAVIDALAGWLQANRRWRRIQFDDVLANSLAVRLLGQADGKKAACHGYFLDRHTSGHRYFVTLPDRMEDYLQRLSASRRKRLGRCTRALEKDGGDAAGQRLADLSELHDYMSVLEQLNSARWHDKGGKGVFESVRFAQFHQKLCALLVPSGGAGITLVKQGESPVAALYLFFSGPVCHYYQSGFRAEGANRYMPLFLGHMAEIEHSIECKLSTYDFMRGAAESYKQDYACESEPMYTLRAWPHNTERLLFIAMRWTRASVARWLRASGVLAKRG